MAAAAAVNINARFNKANPSIAFSTDDGQELFVCCPSQRCASCR
jgi:hypothetical protein